MRQVIIEKIVEYFDENNDIFEIAIEELDSYNGCLGDDRYYNMDELDEIFHGSNLTEILLRSFYGYSEDNYMTDSQGNKEYNQFNPNQDYFRFNGYGNLVSSSKKDYSCYLYDTTIESMLDHREYLHVTYRIDELKALFDELEKENVEQ
jgi:hypothetical protein